MKRSYLLLVILLSVCDLKAQTIQVSLSRLAGEEYSWVLYSGSKLDTIQKGSLDASGKTKLVLPKSQVGYDGMSSLRFKKNNATLDFIVNDENFSISSSAEELSPGNVTFKGSAENNFLVEHYKVQQTIATKLKLLEGLHEMYKSGEAFYTPISEELKKVKQIKQQQNAVIQKSPLYAARFLKLLNYYGELAAYWQKSPAELDQLRSNAIKNFDTDMYNSPLWKPAFEYWFTIYHDGLKSESLFVTDAVKMLQNQNHTPILNELGNNMVDMCEKNGWDNAKMQIAFAIQRSGRLLQPSGNLARLMGAFAAVPGNIAPNIDLGNGTKLSDLSASQYIVLFYETGCSHCDNEIAWLKEHYQQLHEKGVQIISIASDTDKKIAQTNLDIFPWREKLCDLKGFEGENFKTYGVIGTPAIFVLDSNKKITGKYGKFSEAKELELQ